MTILPDAHGCALVTLSGTNQGSKWQNKLHLQVPTGYVMTAGDLSNLLTSISGIWNTDIAPLCNTTVTLTTLQAISLESRTSPIQTLTPVSPPVGTRAGTNLTVQNALTASWVVLNRYRGGHPRTYFPGGVQADVVNGNTWTGTFRTLAASNFNSFLSALNGITVSSGHWVFIMLSYFSGSHRVPGQPKPPPVLRPTPIPFPVAGVAVHPRIDTQRRRLGKEVP